MKRALILTSLSVMAATMITGCFSNSDRAAADTTVTKTFVDTIVVGLGYSCAGGATQYTNGAGQFTCNDGDVVTFSIGDIVLGTVTATSSLATNVSPYNLTNDNTVAVNIAQLIQSCDDDGNITDVIKIDVNKTALFVPSTIAVDDATFDTDANTTLTGAGFALVSNSVAEAHLLSNAPDITAPVITLNGNATEDIREGNAYVEAGATATDTKDGVLAVTTTGTVDTNTVGTYTVTYTATDAAGNEATAERTVNVVANAAPVVTLIGDAEVTVRQGGTYTEQGATATDDLDGDVTANILIAGDVNTSTPGSYTVTYSVTDSEGKTGTTTRTVTVAEDKPPVVTLLGDNPLTRYDSDGAYTDPGATATDDFDPNISASLIESANDVVVNTAGTYHVTWTATDDALSGGQDGSATRTVNVVADLAPVVTLEGNATMTCGQIGGTYTDAGATATDDKDGALTPVDSGTASTVDLSTAGTYTVTWTATDSAGHAGTASRSVTVACQNVNPISGLCEDTVATNPCQ